MPKGTKRTKSLLEQIADISDPRPKDFDIENAGINDNAYLDQQQSGSEDEELSDEELKRNHYVNVGKSALRSQQGIGELGPKYTGSRISRKDLYEEEDMSEDNNTSSEGDESDTGSDAPEEESLSGSDVDADDDGHTTNESAGSDSNASDSDIESDEEGIDMTADEAKNSADSAKRIREEMKRLEEGEKALLSSITQTARSDVEKGQHVLNQTRMWEGSLDARIRVQKLVTAANQLPQLGMFEDLVEERFNAAVLSDGPGDNATQLESTRESVCSLLSSIIELRKTLIAQNPSVESVYNSANASQDSNKRKAVTGVDHDDTSAIWKELESLRAGFKPYRDQSLEKWGNKIQASMGTLALKKFKAVNQGIVHQVNQAMASSDRLIERTQLKRTEYKVIGKAETKHVPEPPSPAQVDAHLKDTDPEIFDDEDFYKQLLRELIESRMVDSNDPMGGLGVRWAAVSQRSDTKKRKVDTKASKGRKVRYHVLEKLQNFMPPVPAGTWHEDMVNELFSSLLGQRLPKSILDPESELHDPGTSKSATLTKSLVLSDEIDISGQGLRLFG
ncbi:TRAUB-domain-containing protein [Coemansia reversa NRRL 1564]|uniref:Protein BFR2 n=1 Tax=Coemansia reversa (strain ATCC 12441 / NRRL 1564) TaxID=763665 RepID=A0A2G5BA63_COERN|nr:TRAUB-domain-containing protein [Coemansia reversa NRRL 1564]|eukprot:PIA15908.1 TRAUB-domain-containing protein [Coemansia reversa NRRL 1564]